MKYAFVNDNEIKKIIEFEDDSYLLESGFYQQIVPIDDLLPPPSVGWIWDNGVFFRNVKPVTPRQIRQALIYSGVSLDMIESALNSLPEPMKSLAKTEWEYSTLFDRRRQLVNQMGVMLGWTSEQLDQLWIFAGSIK